MRELGQIVRLQVQRDSVKSGVKPFQTYAAVPNLTAVQSLSLDANGVSGTDAPGVQYLDVHNATHPRSKFRGENGISIGFTGHYAAMRDRFGDHLTDGIAGENMVVACDERVSLEMIAGGIVIVGKQGELRIGPWVVMHPCAPFSKFCLNMPGEARPDRRVTETLRFLDNGVRGFSAVYPIADETVEIHLGDTVYLL